MEREILFRGRCCDSGSWHEGMPVRASEPPYRICAIDIPEKRTCVQIDPETCGEYTGLTDKNGRRIFEGDILQRNNNPKDIVIVTFGKFPIIDTETESEVDEVIGWYCKVIPTDALSKIRPFCLLMPLTDYYIDRCNIEVINNIHDNPELLGGETND